MSAWPRRPDAPAVRRRGHRPDLRHDPARRRAGARRRPDRGREARGRAPARAAQGRRHRGRLPGRLARRLRGRPADRPGDEGRHRRGRRSPAAATAIRSGPSRRSGSPSGPTSTCSSPRATSTSSTSSGSIRDEALAEAVRWVRYGREALGRDAEIEFSAEDASRTDLDFLLDRSTRPSSRPARRRSTSRTPSATRSRPSSARSSGGSSTSSAATRRSASTATTTWGSPRPTRWPPSRPAPARSRSRSTASASAPATPRSRRSSWPSGRARRSSRKLVSGVQTEQITAASRLVSYLTGFAVQPNKAIVGGNAFAHESGIHQDGVIKNPLTYEIMTPQSVGLTGSQLTIGKLSGRRGLQGKLRELGHEVEGEALDAIYRQAIALADAKKEVTDADLLALVEQRVAEVPASVELVGWSVTSSHGGKATGMVSLTVERGRTAVGRGDRQRPGRRAVRGGRRGAPAGPRLAPGARPSTRSRRCRPARTPRARCSVRCRRSSDEGPGRARRVRPRPIDEHHRGLARGLPRGGEQAPRRRDQRRSVAFVAPRRTRPSVKRPPRRSRSTWRSRRRVPRTTGSSRSRATASGRRSSGGPARSVVDAAGARFGFASTGRSSSSAARRSTPTASPSGPRTSSVPRRRRGPARRGRRARSGTTRTPRSGPEQALFALRGGLGLFANLRPVTVHPALVAVVAAPAGAARRASTC